MIEAEAHDYIESMSVTDVSAHSLGVSVFEGAGGRRRVEVLLGRNSPLPDERSQTFYTMHPATRRSWCPSWRAKGSDPDDYVRIGRVVIEGSPRADRPSAGDRDNVLRPRRNSEVSALDEDSGKSVSPRSSNALAGPPREPRTPPPSSSRR